MGHEFAGEVVEVGASVTDVHVGDGSAARAIWSADAAATAGPVVGICAFTPAVIGVELDGAFAEYVALAVE